MWRFCVTLAELELLTNIDNFTTLYLHDFEIGVLLKVRVVLAYSLSWFYFFKHFPV